MCASTPPDVVGRLTAAGFLVERHSMVEELGQAAAVRHGLIPVDEVLLCRRLKGQADA